MCRLQKLEKSPAFPAGLSLSPIFTSVRALGPESAELCNSYIVLDGLPRTAFTDNQPSDVLLEIPPKLSFRYL